MTITIPYILVILGAAGVGFALMFGKSVALRWFGGAVFLGVMGFVGLGSKTGLPDWLPLVLLGGALVCLLGIYDAVTAKFKRKS